MRILRLPFFVAYSHCSQSNLIPLCFDRVCTLRLLLVVALYSHWSQLYLIPSCLDCLCNLRLSLWFALYSDWSQLNHVSIACALLVDFFCLALYSHWSQSNLIPLRFDSVCTLRWFLMVALHSHWSQSNMPPCFDRVCTLRWPFFVALYSHCSHSNFDIPVFWLFMNPKSLLVRSFVFTLVTTILDSFMFWFFVLFVAQRTFLSCFVLTLITSKFDLPVLRLIMHPKSLLVRCFHVSIVCFDRVCTLRLLFLLLCTHIDRNQIWSPHVSIFCALSDYFWLLLCTHIDHNRIYPWFAWGNCQWFNSSCHISPYKILNLKFLKGQHALVSFRLHISSHCWYYWYYSICYKYIEYHLAKPSILSS